MSKFISFVRCIENNEQYTEAQRSGINNYVDLHNLKISSQVEIQINSTKYEKNLLQLLDT